MTSFLRDDRSTPVAIWLFGVAFLVLCMVVLGGATRLTDSGLSITEWRPISGALPPLSNEAWQEEFLKYQRIPQFSQMNPSMDVESFKFIYWWEWSHRQLGRLIGLVFAVPFIYFLFRKMIPSRLIWRCVVLLALGGLQGFLGWWMVSSGLSERISVAPERLMIHLGLALIIFGALIWTALEALHGKGRASFPGPWARGGIALIILIWLQSMLGGLVAANDAGLIFNDWPLMNGRVFPSEYWAGGLWQTLAHNQASVQLHHRIVGYLIFILLVTFTASAAGTKRLEPAVRIGAIVLGVFGIFQAVLGVITLVLVAPLWISIIHQIVATLLLGVAVWFAWRARRFGGIMLP